MSSQILRLQFDSPTYGALSTATSKIPRGNVIRKLKFTLTQQPTLTTGNNVLANVQPGDGLAAISRLQIIANGGDTLVSLPGTALRMMNYFLLRNNLNVSPQLGAGGANPSLVDTFEIPFECPIFAKPADTWLNTAPLTQLNLSCQWAANAAAVCTGASGYTTAPVLECNIEESSLGVKYQKTNGVIDPTKPASPAYPPVGLRMTTYQAQFTGAGQNQRIDLDAGRFAYAGLIIQATTTATPAVDTGALFSSVSAMLGSTTLTTISEQTLQNVCRDRLDRRQLRTTAGLAYQASPAISPSTADAGWYYMDFLTDGRLSETVATNAYSRFSLFFNTNQACSINVYAIQLLNLTNGNPSP